MSADLNSSPTETSSGNWSARLTREQINLLAECLIAGRSRKQIAEALGVSVRTVSRWKEDLAVLAEVDRLRNRTNEAIAVDYLKSLLVSDDERVVLAAAQALSKIKTPAKPSPAAIVLKVERPKENEEYWGAL
jgi:transcriptional regulator with XRE-family HTH domain